MIGARRETVTRACSKLQEGGCIEIRNRRIYVRDFDALLQNADE